MLARLKFHALFEQLLAGLQGLETQSFLAQGQSDKFKIIETRTTGGGLSAEELQELHKTDPKKVKRILANRSVSP